MRSAILPVVALLIAACGPDPLPVVIVEEHHHAWPAWEAARDRGALPEGVTLLHFDAHADMGEPDLPEGELTRGRARILAEVELAVSDFIVPAMEVGTVGRVLWVIPPWRTDPEGEEEAAEIIRPDAVPEFTEPWVLDIDLDYFACENPHAEHLDVPITKAEYDRLLGEHRIRMEGKAESGPLTTVSRILQRSPDRFSWPIRIDRVTDRETGKTAWIRGTICMGMYRGAFPVRRTTPEEVVSLLDGMSAALEAIEARPAMVTIARSATSGFVPADRVDALEKMVLDRLGRRWSALSVRRNPR